MCLRESPRSFGPGPIGKNTFVATTTDRRSTSASQRPSTRSASPWPYTSAVSKKLTPASYALPRHAFDVFWSTVPPYVSHEPSPTELTRRPERPMRRYSISIPRWSRM